MISKIFKTLFVGVLCLFSVLSVNAQSASLVATDDVSIYASPGQSNVNHNHYILKLDFVYKEF